jgi:hypothetical protein
LTLRYRRVISKSGARRTGPYFSTIGNPAKEIALSPADYDAHTLAIVIAVGMALFLAAIVIAGGALWYRKRPDDVRRIVNAPSRIARATVAAWRHAAWRRADQHPTRTMPDPHQENLDRGPQPLRPSSEPTEQGR